jgi:2Fe-2S ferredoxin
MAKGEMHSVEILPAGHSIAVPDGETIMSVALADGWRWPNVCGGEATCGVCLLEIQEGMQHASPIGRDEAVRLAFIRKADKVGARLACQLRVSGPMRVLKRGARPQAAQSDERGTG